MSNCICRQESRIMGEGLHKPLADCPGSGTAAEPSGNQSVAWSARGSLSGAECRRVASLPASDQYKNMLE